LRCTVPSHWQKPNLFDAEGSIREWTRNTEYKIIHSPLERRISERGISIEVLIYHGEDDAGWILEIVDHTGGSTGISCFSEDRPQALH